MSADGRNGHQDIWTRQQMCKLEKSVWLLSVSVISFVSAAKSQVDSWKTAVFSSSVWFYFSGPVVAPRLDACFSLQTEWLTSVHALAALTQYVSTHLTVGTNKGMFPFLYTLTGMSTSRVVFPGSFLLHTKHRTPCHLQAFRYTVNGLWRGLWCVCLHL